MELCWYYQGHGIPMESVFKVLSSDIVGKVAKRERQDIYWGHRVPNFANIGIYYNSSSWNLRFLHCDKNTLGYMHKMFRNHRIKLVWGNVGECKSSIDENEERWKLGLWLWEISCKFIFWKDLGHETNGFGMGIELLTHDNWWYADVAPTHLVGYSPLRVHVPPT